jgi:hypothetical protein
MAVDPDIITLADIQETKENICFIEEWVETNDATILTPDGKLVETLAGVTAGVNQSQVAINTGNISNNANAITALQNAPAGSIVPAAVNEFTVNGNFQPNAIYASVRITVVAGGGGGSGAVSSSAGGGGGSGAISVTSFARVGVAWTNIAIVVGAGGTGGTAGGGTGGAGGNSTATYEGNLVSASGGGGGIISGGGIGGQKSNGVGQITYAGFGGGNGANPTILVPAVDPAAARGGTGGGEGGGSGAAVPRDGQANTGGGGQGGTFASATATNGGDGADGRVIIEVFS